MPSSDLRSPQSLKDENLRLRRAIEELSVLNDLARTIGALASSQEVMEIIIRQSIKATNAEQGVITLVDPEPDAHTRTLVRTTVSSADHGGYHLNQSLLGWMHLHAKPLMLTDPPHDERFLGVAWDPSIRSLLCVPLMVKSVLKGVLTVYNKRDDTEFTEDDQRLLGIIAAQSAQVIENARLSESEQALIRIRQELQVAAQIQRELLPRRDPVIYGYDIAGKTLPAQTIGGDYFDFFHVDGGREAICLGDVSGKGLPASLLMANVQATLRGQGISGISACECLRRSNRLLYYSTSSDKFVTLVYALLDWKQHTLTYSNAGHESPLLFSRAGMSRLATGGVILGILEQFPFQEETVALEPNDTVVIFSDGINEAMDSGHVQFGYERLAAVVGKVKDAPAAEQIDRIIEAVRLHAGSQQQTDDMTVVVVRRL